MSGQIRIAILGVQHYHANFWTRAVLQSDKAMMAGIWDPDPVLAAKFAQTQKVDYIADCEELLAVCDAVAICSATSDHREFIRKAAHANLPILCEKPLGISTDDNIEIREIVETAGVRFMQSFPKRFDPATAAVRNIVESGDLGDIFLCRVRHGHSHGLGEEFRKEWFVDPAKSGGGTLLDEGIHAADFLRYIFGEPEEANAAISSSTLGLPVEDTAQATFSYADGLIAEVSTSWCFAAADASIEIYGTSGTLLLRGVDIASRPTSESDFLRVFRSGSGWESLDVLPHFKTGVFHEHVMWAFLDALAAGTPMPVGIDDGIRAFAMIDAAYRAARTGARTLIAYPGIST